MPIIKHNLIPECPHCKRLKKKSLDLFITRNAPERLAIRQKAMQKIKNALVKRNARVVPAGMHTPEEAIIVAACDLSISMKMVPKIIKSLDEMKGDTLFVRMLPNADFLERWSR